MKQSILKLAAIAGLTIALATSCDKASTSQQAYPDELTWENKEAFLDAPKEVMDDVYAKLYAKYPAQRQQPTVANDHPTEAVCLNRYIGFVTAWNGSAWVGINGVAVTNTGEAPVFTASTPTQSGRYIACLNSMQSCMAYNVVPNTNGTVNGVEQADAFLVYFHAQAANNPASPNRFENIAASPEDAARMYVAADVDNNGTVTTADASRIYFNSTGSTAANATFVQEVSFVPYVELDLTIAADPFGLGFLNNPCRNVSNSQFWFRRCVRKGDIDGTFNF